MSPAKSWPNSTPLGFNPYFHSADLVEEVMGGNADVQRWQGTSPTSSFTGRAAAGTLRHHPRWIAARLSAQLQVVVDHDLVGAAYSTYDGRPGITCIIGTGSNSCHFDGKRGSGGSAGLGLHPGRRGERSWHGKKLAAKLYHHLPAEVAADFDRTYGYTKSDIIDKVYREADPNVFLASFMTFIGKHKEQPLRGLVKAWFEAFVDVHVKCFSNWNSEPVHFIGSVAYHFQEELPCV